MAVAILHTLFAVVVFRQTFADMLRLGMFDVVGQDAMVAAAVWFLLFGLVLGMLALAVHALERQSAQFAVLRRLGAATMALGVLGIVWMPQSGFWLLLPAAVALLRKRA